MFFAGGIKYGGQNTAVVDIYDLATNTWTVASLWQARDRIGATSVGNKVLFAGGFNTNSISTKAVDIYDLTTNTWSKVDLSQSRFSIGAASAGGKALFGGGLSFGDVSSVVDLYTAATNTWTTTNLSVARTEVRAASVGNKIFFGGGNDKFILSNVVDIYNATTNSWTTSNLSLARSSIAVTSAGGKVFFAGGLMGNSGMTPVVDIYTVGLPTIITQQPTPAVLNACVGGTVSSILTATGEGTLVYQWYKKGSPDVALPTQNTATLTLSNLQATDAGTYYCVVTGELETVSSTPVTVNVASPAFTSGPLVTPVSVCTSESITVTLATTCFPAGNTFTAQLSDASGNFGNPVNLGTVTAGSNSLLIPAGTPTANGYKIRILPSTPGLPNAVSAAFTVTASGFVGKPTITGTPVCAGQSVQLSFTAGCFPAGTTFTAELSDANGSFAAPVKLGSVTSGNNPVSIPAGTGAGTGYQIRIVGSNGEKSIPTDPFPVRELKITTPGVTGAPVCAGQNVDVSFGVEFECPLRKDNVFTAQLSDASGKFLAPVALGQVNPGSNSLQIPFGTPAGTGYKIRIVASNPKLISGESAEFEVKTAGFGVAPVLSLVPVCAGNGLLVTFGLTCPFPAGTTLTAELSDKNGSFAAPAPLGSVVPGTTNVTIPAATPAGSGYRIRIKSSTGAISLPSTTFQVNAPGFAAAPTVNGVPVCAGKPFGLVFNTVGCAFPAGNEFKAQLSNANGDFGAATSLGVVVPGNNSLLIPANLPAGNGYRVRVVASKPSLISAPSLAFVVNQPGFGAQVSVSGTPVCKGSKVVLTFTTVAPCDFGAGNQFKAQLSDASGSFASPVALGVVSPNGANITIPPNTPTGSGYRIRVVSNNPALTSASSAPFGVNTCKNSREGAPDETGLTVQVSPNPSTEGRLHIQVSGVKGQLLHVELFNSAGFPIHRQLVEQAANEDVMDWDITQKPAGLYLLRVNAGLETKTVKVLH